MDYGTGAIFACPAHDQRDLDFCRKYDLPVVDTFLSLDEPRSPSKNEAFVPPKTEKVKWVDHFAGLDEATGEEAIDATVKFAEAAGWGTGVEKFRLRDWGLSRQRYWGCPIPVVHCDDCGVVPRRKRTCRSNCRGCQLRHPRQPAGPSPDVARLCVPVLRQARQA